MYKGALAQLLVLLLCASVASSVQAQGRRDILWNIVSNCLGRDSAQHTKDCIAPRQAPLAQMQFATPAEATRYCRSGTDVWGEVPDQFVAFRDIKMCACPTDASFVHGLAIPYAKVRGVEGPNRPDGIWQFAWDTGIGKVGLAQKEQLGLVVNPQRWRSQDQLHVHIVRMRADFSKFIAEHPHQVMRTVHLKDLSQVWREAPLPADAVQSFRDFGVVITSDGADGYVLRVINPRVGPEDEYTQYACPR